MAHNDSFLGVALYNTKVRLFSSELVDRDSLDPLNFVLFAAEGALVYATRLVGGSIRHSPGITL